MSALQVYLNWAKSVLSDCDPPPIVNVDSIRQGKVLCQIIETFWDATQDERLQHWDLVPGSSTAIDYIQAALSHLESRNIKVNFKAEDILGGDIKSILDLLWLLILNYNIHDAGTNQYHQCSVGAGRRNLLAWCQNTLAGLQLDKRCSLVRSLCNNDHFLMLLESTPGLKLPAEDLPTKSQHLVTLLENIESQFGIRKDILSVPELIAGTIDEQILMIYLALLKWKIENKQTKSLHSNLWKDLPQPQSSVPSSSSLSSDQTRCKQIKNEINLPEKQVLSPKQSSSIDESSEKEGVKQLTHHATPPLSTVGGSPVAISINTTNTLPSRTPMMETKSLSNLHFGSGDSFSLLHSDKREASLEDELSHINNSFRYGNPVHTQHYARSLTPTITVSAFSGQSESRPNYSDFRASPSLFSRPRSAMGLSNWTESHDGYGKIVPNMSLSYSTTAVDKVDTRSHMEQREMNLTRYGNLGREASLRQSRIDTNPDYFGNPQRRQETEKTSENAYHKVNLSSQPATPPVVELYGEDGTYSFKKVFITKDRDNSQIQAVPITIEKDISFQSSISSTSKNPKVQFVEQPNPLDKTNFEEQEKIETKNQDYPDSDGESAQPPPPPLNAPPSSPPLFEMEQFRIMKAASINKSESNEMVDAQSAEEDTLTSAESSKQTKRKLITRQLSIDQDSRRDKQSNHVAAGNKMQDIADQDEDVMVPPDQNTLSDNSHSNLAAASVTSKKIDILCLEIGELKKKVMAMETGRTYLADLNRSFQSALDSDTKGSKPHIGGQRKKALELNKTSKTNFQKQNDIPDRMNQTWTPSTNSLLEFESELDDNRLKNSSLHSLSFHSGFTLNNHHEDVSFQKEKLPPSKTSSVSTVSPQTFHSGFTLNNPHGDVSFQKEKLPPSKNSSVSTVSPQTFHSGFMLNNPHGDVSFQKEKLPPSKTSSVSTVSPQSPCDFKERNWRTENKGENFARHQQTSQYIDPCVTVKSTRTQSPFSTSIEESLIQQNQKGDQLVSVNNKDSEKLEETNQRPSLKNDLNHDDNDGEGPSVKSPSKAFFGSVNCKSEVDELLSRYASGGNMIMGRMCTILKALTQENETLKSRLQQEMGKLQILNDRLQEVQSLREEDAKRAQLEQFVQEDQTVMHQENTELRKRLNISEELNTKLKTDVLKLQQYKNEIQHTQRNLRERILRAEKDKKILSEELSLLWRQRKAMRQSNYEISANNTGMVSPEDMITPPKSRPSLVEAAFSNRLHQVDKKTRSPLTSSPAGQRLSVAPFPISPVVSNNLENQSPECLYNRLGILYPETPKTPKTYRHVSCLEREKKFFPPKNRSSTNTAPPIKSPMRSGVAPDLELDQLLDEVEGHSEICNSIAFDDEEDDDNSDNYDKDVIQLQKRQRLYWSDENLSRHSENTHNGWLADDSLERSPRSASDLHLSQAANATKTGRRRMNNVTFNLSNSAGNVPSKQKSTLKGILKKANPSTQYNTDNLSNGLPKTSGSKTHYTQGPHHHSSEDLFLEISQQDFLDPPNVRASNSSKGMLAVGMGKRWSSHDSLHSKYTVTARQRDFNELDSDQSLKGPSINPDDINFSFSDQMSGCQNNQQSQQKKPYPTESSSIRNRPVFRHLIRSNSMENSPEERPLFGDPNDSRWSFTPYNFYLETLSQQLNEQNRYTEKPKPNNPPPSSDTVRTAMQEIHATDSNTDPQKEDSAISSNSSPGKGDVLLNSSDKSTPAKSGPSTSSAGSGGSQKFSSVLSPEQVEFSPTSDADRKAIVRNLCSVFENSDLSLDGSEPGSAKKSRTWYDLDKTPPAQLTDEQRTYANTLIEKYTRLPTDRLQKSAT